MRLLIAFLLVLGLASFGTMGGPSAPGDGTFVVAAQEVPSQVDVDISTDGGGWFADPIWIAIGVIAVIAVIAIIVAASRGGTTIVKD